MHHSITFTALILVKPYLNQCHFERCVSIYYRKKKSISKIVAFILSTFFLCSFFLKRIFNRKQRKRKSRKETERDAMEWKKKEKKEKLPTGTNVYKNIHNYKYANECWINKHLIKSIYWKWDWSTFVFYVKNLKI